MSVMLVAFSDVPGYVYHTAAQYKSLERFFQEAPNGERSIIVCHIFMEIIHWKLLAHKTTVF